MVTLGLVGAGTGIPIEGVGAVTKTNMDRSTTRGAPAVDSPPWGSIEGNLPVYYARIATRIAQPHADLRRHEVVGTLLLERPEPRAGAKAAQEN